MRFEMMPSRPSAQACRNSASPSAPLKWSEKISARASLAQQLFQHRAPAD
jgi:hypothetical protein